MAVYTTTETGALNDVNQLMDNLHQFILNNTDFTIELFEEHKTGKRLIIKKGVLYYNFYSSIKEGARYSSISDYDSISSFISDSFDPLLDFNDAINNKEQRARYTTQVFQDDMPFYGFYWNGRNFVIVAEWTNGFYSFTNFGEIETYGSYNFNLIESNYDNDYSTGVVDEYNYAPLFYDYNSMIYADNKFFNDINSNNPECFNDMQGQGMTFIDPDFQKAMSNKLNGKSTLFYNKFYSTSEFRNTFLPIAEQNDYAMCSSEFLQPQEEFLVGNKKYIFFPFFFKEDPIDYRNRASLGMGIAIRIE